MERLRQYALCIIAASLLCSIVTKTVKSTKNSELLSLLCSLFLLFCLISPLYDADISSLAGYSDFYAEDANCAVEEGKNIASEMKHQRIMHELETYILSKAEGMDLAISVDITLNSYGIPEEAIMQGRADPYQKEAISQILEYDLGIPKESQTWTG